MSGQTGSGDSAFDDALLAHGGIPNLAGYPPELLQQAGLLGPSIVSSDALQVRALAYFSPMGLQASMQTSHEGVCDE